MSARLRGLLHLRPGEERAAARIALLGAVCTAATSLGDTVAQSVFVSRVGADRLPAMFLAKGLLDVLAAAAYLPLAQGRGAARVLRVVLLAYALSAAGGRLLLGAGGGTSAYALYVLHECAWTLITIHWGVYLLEVFDASQARRLFPLLFAAARLGAVAAGALVSGLSHQVGAANLLAVAAALAAAAALLSPAGGAAPAAVPAAVVNEEPGPELADGEEAPRTRFGASWRRALESPLVRAIAVSTAAMVGVRFALKLTSLDAVAGAYGRREDAVAAFLGTLDMIANGVGILLGVVVVPRVLFRFGVGAANLAYAAASLAACGAVAARPSLAAAAAARFVDVHLKDALKTPLSALFYGAEPPDRRAPARALLFGAVIPAATVAASGGLEVARRAGGILAVALLGCGLAAIFVVASAAQNRRWRRRLADLLLWKLARADAVPAERVSAAAARLAPWRGGRRDELLARIAAGLSAREPRLRAVAEELLAETIPRAEAHRIARESAG